MVVGLAVSERVVGNPYVGITSRLLVFCANHAIPSFVGGERTLKLTGRAMSRRLQLSPYYRMQRLVNVSSVPLRVHHSVSLELPSGCAVVNTDRTGSQSPPMLDFPLKLVPSGEVSRMMPPKTPISVRQYWFDLESNPMKFRPSNCGLETSTSRALCGALLADDATVVWGDGTTDNKPSTLELFRSGRVRYEQLDYDNNQVRMFGDIAIVTGDARVKAGWAERPSA